MLVMSNSDDVIISLNDVIAADQTQQMARQMSMQGSPALSAKQDPNQLFKVHIYLSHSSHSMTMAPCTHVCTHCIRLFCTCCIQCLFARVARKINDCFAHAAVINDCFARAAFN